MDLIGGLFPLGGLEPSETGGYLGGSGVRGPCEGVLCGAGGLNGPCGMGCWFGRGAVGRGGCCGGRC